MQFIWPLFVAVLLSGLILTYFCYYSKRFLVISRLVVDTEMGRGLTAVFTGITTLCTIFTFKELGSSPLLAISIVFELCSLFFSTLGLALYPIMIKSAVSIYSHANQLKKGISEEFSNILQKYNPAITEGVINDILEEKKIVEQIIEGRGKEAGFWVYFLILIYYYAFSFALIGIAFLIVVFGIVVF